MKIFSSNNQSYQGIFNYFFLIVEGHSKHYFSYIMPEYPVVTSCHKQTISKWKDRQHKGQNIDLQNITYKTNHRATRTPDQRWTQVLRLLVIYDEMKRFLK
jgi:hypothetical protein